MYQNNGDGIFGTQRTVFHKKINCEKMSIFLHKVFWCSLRSPVWKDGSTAVTTLVMDDVLYVANLGDSKVHITTSIY